MSAPANLVVDNPSASTVDTGWDAVSGASKYRVQYRRGSSGGWTTATSSETSTSYTVTGLACGTSYQFQVAGYGDGTTWRAAWGPDSTAKTLSTLDCPPPDAPTGLMATPGDGQISLSWSNPSDSTITGYQYRLRTPADTDWQKWTIIPGSGPSTT